MNKLILGILVAFNFAITSEALSNQNMHIAAASEYADDLIQEFDQELDLLSKLSFKKDMLNTEVYAKIVAARIFLEHSIHDDKTNNKSFVLESYGRTYSKVVKEINNNSKKIYKSITDVNKSIQDEPIIFPSSTSSGNITGNTFPKKVWALTFDDGPHQTRTQLILNALSRRNLKATFFQLMKKIDQLPETAIDVQREGHDMALHSYNHLQLPKQTQKTVEYEIGFAKEKMEDFFHQEIKLFRLPYGAGTRTTRIRDHITDKNLIHLFWNVDTLDWKDKDPESILARVKKQMKASPNNAGVILFHDIQEVTVTASAMVMDYLISNKYQTCTVQEIIDFQNGLEQDCVTEQ